VTDTPTEIVQRQLDAYNDHDIDAFVATYAPDIELFKFPGDRFCDGSRELRERYGNLFQQFPKLEASVSNRIEMGNFIIDDETVSIRPGESQHHALAIYEVKHGHITRVWFRAENDQVDS